MCYFGIDLVYFIGDFLIVLTDFLNEESGENETLSKIDILPSLILEVETALLLDGVINLES